MNVEHTSQSLPIGWRCRAFTLKLVARWCLCFTTKVINKNNNEVAPEGEGRSGKAFDNLVVGRAIRFCQLPKLSRSKIDIRAEWKLIIMMTRLFYGCSDRSIKVTQLSAKLITATIASKANEVWLDRDDQRRLTATLSQSLQWRFSCLPNWQ